jgi:carboxyl-terminal processing protease
LLLLAENHLATIIGEKTAGRLLSATSLKVGKGFRLALPAGVYRTWSGSIYKGKSIEPDLVSDFDRQNRLINSKDRQLEFAVDACVSLDCKPRT